MNVRLVLASGAALGAIALSSPALAQDAPASEPAAEEEGGIIVTARRQSESLQDVPAAVTVFGAETLAKTGVQRADDFIQLTPGVTIVTGTAEAGDTQINIRGINGARDAESSVALVVDGILKTNTAQLNQNQGTLRQVEILKGPQGALYGRNAAAGAIVLQTLKPGDALEGGMLVRAAQDNTYLANGYISTPIGDTAGLVLSANYSTTDGFFRNSFLGNSKTIDDQEVFGIDGRFVAELGPNTELDVKARYADLRGASINFNASFHLPNFAAVNPAFFEDVNEHPFGFYSNIRPTNDQVTFETSAKVEHEFESTTLTAWVLYSDVDQSLTADSTSADFARFTFPGATPASVAAANACAASTTALTGFPLNPPTFIGASPIPFIFNPATGSTFGPYSPTTCDGTQFQVRKQEDISGEIRLASNGDGAINWQVGAYYLHIDREVGVSLGADLGRGIIRELYNAPGSDNPTTQLYHDAFKTDVYAAFASIDADVSDRFNVSFAGRYDIEDRQVSSLVPAVFDPIAGGPINPGQTVSGGVVQPIAPKSETFKQFQPKISLRYELTDDINLYGNWGIGFKSGGFNNQGSAAIVDSAFNDFIGTNVLIDDQYRKEVSSAFEAGMKGTLLDGAVTFDLAGYYTKVEDMQFFEFFVGGFGLLRVVSNIDEVELYGAELNLSAEILDGWTVFGSGNVTESEIRENASRPVTVGNKSPYTADYTINVGTQLDLPVTDSVNFVTRADYRITGPTWFHTLQDDPNPTLFSGLLPGSALALPAFVGDADYSISQRDTFGVMDLRVGVEGDSWSLTAYAENLFNEKYLNEVITAVEFGGSFISPGARQRFGVEFGYKF
ncbi:iron complex outermembrane receptor protein [Erythromicrobium ramosum]|uniref:Iron complex outermembrane receptor protein n=1 Tax=Erythrobacter ramosus TaxID=35811 RepID=A0A6I4UNY7_9SPHN|nr:TonB-dependent receptor [Erythrobacter ramosus]MBB3775431.1 iron complex outermembrane receptor protein [Erythrobacter ramosus]MXP39464.1 TonB-dependent receptor [Erythrobacter ramosus]